MEKEIKRGDVVLVALSEEAFGHEHCGIRPAVVIQNNVGNLNSPTTIVALISSKEKRYFPMHVAIKAGAGGLHKPGRILCEQIRVIDKTRITKFIGSMNSYIMEKVDKALKISIGV